jgi:hypothetical protein
VATVFSQLVYVAFALLSLTRPGITTTITNHAIKARHDTFAHDFSARGSYFNPTSTESLPRFHFHSQPRYPLCIPYARERSKCLVPIVVFTTDEMFDQCPTSGRRSLIGGEFRCGRRPIDCRDDQLNDSCRPGSKGSRVRHPRQLPGRRECDCLTMPSRR